MSRGTCSVWSASHAPRLTMVQEELGKRHQCPLAAWVFAQPPVQGLQAGEGAVQEGGVLPAQHVQEQHSFYQALQRQRAASQSGQQCAVSQSGQHCHSYPTGYLQLSVGPSPLSSVLLEQRELACLQTAPQGRLSGSGHEQSCDKRRPWRAVWDGARCWQPGDSLRLLCSNRRWQYSKATSLSRSRGGSSRLAVEAAESTDRVEPSSSDLSSVRQKDGLTPCGWQTGRGHVRV